MISSTGVIDSDLRNKFPEIEKAVGGEDPVYLTKNGYGAMFVLSLDAYQSGFLEGTTPTSDKIMEVRRFLYTISGTVIGPSKEKLLEEYRDKHQNISDEGEQEEESDEQ